MRVVIWPPLRSALDTMSSMTTYRAPRRDKRSEQHQSASDSPRRLGRSDLDACAAFRQSGTKHDTGWSLRHHGRSTWHRPSARVGLRQRQLRVRQRRPVATNDAYGVSQNVTKAVIANDGVLANDSDANGDTLTAVLVTPPASGTLALAADGSFGYTPTNNFIGTVTLSPTAPMTAQCRAISPR